MTVHRDIGWCCLIAVDKDFAFSAITSIPHTTAPVSSLVAKFWSFAWLPPIRSMSSVKYKLHRILPPMGSEMLKSDIVLQVNVEQNEYKRQPCRKPTLVLKKFPKGIVHENCAAALNDSETSPPTPTFAIIPICTASIIVVNFSGHPYFLCSCHSPVLPTASNALTKSTNTMYFTCLTTVHLLL